MKLDFLDLNLKWVNPGQIHLFFIVELCGDMNSVVFLVYICELGSRQIVIALHFTVS